MKILSQYTAPFLPLVATEHLAEIDYFLVEILDHIEQGKIKPAMAQLEQLPHRTAKGMAYVLGIELLKAAPTSNHSFELLASCTHFLDRACQEHPDHHEPLAMAGWAHAMLAAEWLNRWEDLFTLPQVKHHLQTGRDAMELALKLEPNFESLLAPQIELVNDKLGQLSTNIIQWAEEEREARDLHLNPSNDVLPEGENTRWQNASAFFAEEWEKKQDKYAGYGLALCQLQLGIAQHDPELLRKAESLFLETLQKHQHFHQADFFLGQTYERLAELYFREELESEGEENRTVEMISQYQKALHHYQRASETCFTVDNGISSSIPRVKERLAILQSLHDNAETNPTS